MDELIQAIKTTNALLIIIAATNFASYLVLLFRNFGGKKDG